MPGGVSPVESNVAVTHAPPVAVQQDLGCAERDVVEGGHSGALIVGLLGGLASATGLPGSIRTRQRRYAAGNADGPDA